MELWILFLFLGIGCLLIGIAKFTKTPSAPLPNPARPRNDACLNPGEMSVLPNSSLPDDWNPTVVATQLRRLRDTQPDVIPHVIREIKKRFVIRADDRTAKAMIDFLGTTLQGLNLEKECAQAVQDLKAMSREYELRLKKLDLQVLETERDHQKVHLDIESQAVVRELERQRDIARLKQEIAQIEGETERIKNPPKAEGSSPVTPEQQRTKDKHACEERIANLKQEKQTALKIADEGERVFKVNALDDALQREYERWAKLI